MKRELKFRVWDKEDRRMITHEQDFIPLKVCSLGVLRLSPHYEENLYSILPADRFELLQFTGLHDKNGKEIYEGDVVHVVYGKGNEFMGDDADYKDEVYFDADAAAFMIKRPIGADSLESGGLSGKHSIEVIGNRYEHPHLLTQQQVK